MTQIQHNQLVSFIWNIANDVLVNVYNKGDYRKVILPMIVLRRFDAVLEDTKKEVLAMKERLTAANIIQQDEALCAVAGQAFCNSSSFTLKDLKSRTNSQQLKLGPSRHLGWWMCAKIILVDKKGDADPHF